MVMGGSIGHPFGRHKTTLPVSLQSTGASVHESFIGLLGTEEPIALNRDVKLIAGRG